MINYTKNNLKKLESILEELDFKIRYEKGNFNSGFCVVENSKVIVINKFYDTQGRILTIIDILSQRSNDTSTLSPPSLKLYQTLFPENEQEKTAES